MHPCAVCTGRVFTMSGYYFVMSRRYICYKCQSNHAGKVASGLIGPKEKDSEKYKILYNFSG